MFTFNLRQTGPDLAPHRLNPLLACSGVCDLQQSVLVREVREHAVATDYSHENSGRTCQSLRGM